MRRKVGFALAGLLALGTALAVNAIWFRPFFIGTFFLRTVMEELLDSPEELTSLRLLEPWGIRGHNAKLSDASEAHELEFWARIHQVYGTLKSYDPAKLSPADRLSWEVLEWNLRLMLDGEKFRLYNYPVNQIGGIQNELPSFLMNQHSVSDRRDADDYIARLGLIGVKFDQVTEGLELREKAGVIPPVFIIERVLDEMRRFVKPKPAENPLYMTFQEKLAKVDSIDERARAELLSAAADRIENVVYPAYAKLIARFEALKPRATRDAGVWKFKDGDAFYAQALRQNTTTDLAPEKIHQIGLSEVARIEGEIRAVLAKQGITGGTAGELLVRVSRDPRFLFEDKPESREQILAGYRRMLEEADAAISTAFNIRPKAALEVRRIPEFREEGSAGAYYEDAALDGSRPGIFYANLRDVRATPKFDMRTLAHHEGIPGHHFQVGIAQELHDLPLFRRMTFFTAYVEGWALYAERLAPELGVEKDPMDSVGRLRAELFRAVRLVVDTGIHRMRWTREKAIDYMVEHTGMNRGEVTAEIERYIVWPGQACAYKIGMLKILELREKAKSRLGDRFRLADFHDVILKDGALPLELLEKQVDQYIADRWGSASAGSVQ